MFLRTDDMKKYVEGKELLPEGTQWHVNHEECPSGVDRKQRLYIKITGEGWLFYCQHCGSKGFLRIRDRIHRYSAVMAAADVPISVHMPAKARDNLLDKLKSFAICTDYNSWDAAAKIWWYSYGFDGDDARLYGVVYDLPTKRLWLPMANGAVWQGRWVGERMEGTPKYITIWADPFSVAASFSPLKPYNIVLVEDILSAYKIIKAGGNVLCLMGTKLQDKHKAFLATLPGYNIIVWLDDDEAGNEGAMNIIRELSHRTTLMIHHYQPKEATIEYIQEVLTHA